MSFSIEIQPQHQFKRIRIIDNELQVHTDILSKGGILNSWTQPPSQNNWDIIDGNSFENGWSNFEDNGFKSGKMNPFSCRLNRGTYSHENHFYQFNKFYLGEHALHGLVYDADFKIASTNISENHASVLLEYEYHQFDNGFPFHFTIQLLWTLWRNNKITVETTLINQGNNTFPMMDGWHPYFKLGSTIDDCTLQFQCKGILEYDKNLIPTGKVFPNTQFDSPQSLAGIELDNGYLLEEQHLNCILESQEFRLIVSPAKAYPYLQLYTPPGRKSIAIENLSGAPDCFNNKMGLHIMQPQEVWTLVTSYQLITF